MKMSELILQVGDDNVIFQTLDGSIESMNKTKHGTKITFLTDAAQAEEVFFDGRTKKIGLVLWLPRDAVEKAIAAAKMKDAKHDG